MADALIGLGGNLGDVPATFVAALDRLAAAGVRVVTRSSNWRTPPWGLTRQPPFVNACVRVATTLEPQALLALLLATESDLGRVRTIRWGPRAIDLDLLDVDGRVVAEPNLTLPHPRLAERAFVLVPLAEIVPDRLIGGRRVADLLAAVDTTGIERLPPDPAEG
ncbi:2-amino-4-hydroxy-6-hydroxymethyldihydropteridine diphosphokinase [Siculibacillus lacustris]|uniref:2-amino-4-hydroxy-6-hydroxymethyldihydropteridine pyrophosphokinase n=1 Tax=Siculibacillus lacustris TaxID=1549641 RepID=A0A4Q9VP04_9HYPH|nr:2-amino-4-hydroxy-6-hydroxymethyldihydropteridine diphosphokinase [Siculibacillus lacustris]TBW37415.1 2-amino-4-hydroxy-6-hydroxymethyldihydropteridine diphosphokinase [Siculibacillus lacustris]